MQTAMVLSKRESTKEEIITYLHDRLSNNSKFSKENIKVIEIWYDWRHRLETKSKLTRECEWTRKITIERMTSSKVGEGFKAFFSSFVDLQNVTRNYNLDRTDLMHMERAVQELFSDEAIDKDNITENVNKVYTNCQKIEFWVSLENGRRKRGPIFTNTAGIAIACNAGKIANKVVSIVLAILSIGLSAKKSCIIV